VKTYADAAAAIAALATARMEVRAPCAPGTEEACAAERLAEIGRRLFRRRLTEEERRRWLALRAAVKAGGGASLVADAAVVEGMLQAPAFLYRIELGRPPAAPDADRVALTDDEVAARISYLVTEGPPDDALAEAAGAGKLRSAAERSSHAARLLAGPAGREGLRAFFRQWLGLDRIAQLKKDPTLDSLFGLVRRDLPEEPLRLVEEVVLAGDGRLSSLLTATTTSATGALGVVYGVQGRPFEWAPLALDPAQRGGLLTQPWFPTLHSGAVETTPSRRGLFVRERLLCQDLPPPPADVHARPPAASRPDETPRERLSAATGGAFCQTCHALIDPIGLAFEHYDAIGRYRDRDGSRRIDASGAVPQSDVAGEIAGAVELSRRLASSRDVRECFAEQLYRYAHGRSTELEDGCRLFELAAAFSASGGNVRTLIATLVGREELSTRPTEGLVLPPPPPAAIAVPAAIPPTELPRALVGLLRAEYADLAARLTGEDRRRAEAHAAHLAHLAELDRARR
jgi:hypothetical protein